MSLLLIRWKNGKPRPTFEKWSQSYNQLEFANRMDTFAFPKIERKTEFAMKITKFKTILADLLQTYHIGNGNSKASALTSEV